MNFLKSVFSIFAIVCVLSTSVFAGIYQPQADGLLRIKRDHGHGITGPVHTYVKTDKHANFKWGVRHHVGKHFAGN